jgi:hypothetical protein
VRTRWLYHRTVDSRQGIPKQRRGNTTTRSARPRDGRSCCLQRRSARASGARARAGARAKNGKTRHRRNPRQRQLAEESNPSPHPHQSPTVGAGSPDSNARKRRESMPKRSFRAAQQRHSINRVMRVLEPVSGSMALGRYGIMCAEHVEQGETKHEAKRSCRLQRRSRGASDSDYEAGASNARRHASGGTRSEMISSHCSPQCTAVTAGSYAREGRKG